MTVTKAVVASIVGLLVLVVLARINRVGGGVMVMLACRDCSSGMDKLMPVRRSDRHAQCERTEHYRHDRQKLAQNQHRGSLIAGHVRVQPASGATEPAVAVFQGRIFLSGKL